MSKFHLASVAAIAAITTIAGAPPAVGGEPVTLHIGVQKYGTLVILAEQHTLEQRLAAEGVSVTWTEFPAGPQLLEALSAGAIDIGTTGEAPPVFAQSAGSSLVYIGVEPSAPAGEAILVPKDSPIQSIADLKGKRVAYNKGSNVHYLLVEALAAAGFDPHYVENTYLAPSDARAAFERGSVDAWVIWDPFLAQAQAATGGRILLDATGLAANRQFYLARRDFATEHPGLVDEVLDEIGRTDHWAAEHQHEVAELLSPRTGIDVPVLQLSLDRLGYGVTRLDDRAIEGQQQIADTFFKLGLMPRAVTIRDAVWAPNS